MFKCLNVKMFKCKAIKLTALKSAMKNKTEVVLRLS